VRILDAFGMDIVLVETVGAGQSEVDIVRMAHTSVVMEVPGMGDDIQAFKAGILEIGDVFAVNKADRGGADRTILELEAMLELGDAGRDGRRPPVLRVVAKTGEGVKELAAAIDDHRAYLRESGEYGRRVMEQTRAEFLEIVKDDIRRYIV
jgi:GTPase